MNGTYITGLRHVNKLLSPSNYTFLSRYAHKIQLFDNGRERFFVGYEENEFLKVTLTSIQHTEIDQQVNGPSSNSLLCAFGDGCTWFTKEIYHFLFILDTNSIEQPIVH